MQQNQCQGHEKKHVSNRHHQRNLLEMWLVHFQLSDFYLVDSGSASFDLAESVMRV